MLVRILFVPLVLVLAAGVAAAVAKIAGLQHLAENADLLPKTHRHFQSPATKPDVVGGTYVTSDHARFHVDLFHVVAATAILAMDEIAEMVAVVVASSAPAPAAAASDDVVETFALVVSTQPLLSNNLE